MSKSFYVQTYVHVYVYVHNHTRKALLFVAAAITALGLAAAQVLDLGFRVYGV